MSTPLNPLDVLEKAIYYGITHPCTKGSAAGKPGAVIQKMTPEEREALTRLTSDQTVNMRALGR